MKESTSKRENVKAYLNKEKRNVSKKVSIFLIVILFLVIIQTAIIMYLGYNILYSVPDKINSTQYQLSKRIDLVDIELESKISELSNGLIETRTDLGKQIGIINAKTSSDFSSIIQTAFKSVVSIRTNVAQGSGFIIAKDGYIVTNAHILGGAKYAQAITSDQEIIEMDLIGYNITSDIALLKIDGVQDYLELRDSNEIRIGEKVIAIGNPLGLSFSVSEGIVSAINREGSNGMNAYVQTDASLNPGNSGGPLIGTDGKVIGINNFKAYGESLGFALESNYIKESVNQIALKNLNMTILD